MNVGNALGFVPCSLILVHVNFGVFLGCRWYLKFMDSTVIHI